jgi:hypothetical protein
MRAALTWDRVEKVVCEASRKPLGDRQGVIPMTVSCRGWTSNRDLSVEQAPFVLVFFLFCFVLLPQPAQSGPFSFDTVTAVTTPVQLM